MKKLVLFSCLLLAATFARAAFTPIAGVLYNIVQTSSNLVVGAASTQPVVQTLANTTAQAFEFIPVSDKTDTYYLKSIDGNYLNKSTVNDWRTVYQGTVNGTNSEWVISGTDASSVRLMLTLNSKYLASDNTTTGSALYCDKTSTHANGLFQLTPMAFTGIKTSTTSLPVFTNLPANAQASAERSFNVWGGFLTGNIIITAPTNFEIATVSGSSFANQLILTQVNGTVAKTTIYVRLKAGLAANTYSGNITLESSGYNTQIIALSAVVGSNLMPADGILYNILQISSNLVVGASSTQPVISTASGLSSQSFVFVPVAGKTNTYFIKNADGNYLNMSTADTWTTVYEATANGTNSEWVVCVADANSIRMMVNSSNGYFGSDNIVDGSVLYYDKDVNNTNTLFGLSATMGLFTSKNTLPILFSLPNAQPSAEQSFSMSGLSLTGTITITAPANYEISTGSGSSFADQLTFTPSNGTISKTFIYVRLKAGLAANTYSGNITLESSGYSTKSVALSGEVRSTPPTILNVTTAGTLSNMFSADEKTTITNLTLTGTIDSRDIKCIRDEMKILAFLDISTVTIKAYNGVDGTSITTTSYPAHQMPCYSFYDEILKKSKITLQTIILPTSITSIGQSAFFYCSGLTGNLKIPDLVTSIGERSFSHCTNITTLSLPENIITIGIEAFATCSGLTGDLIIGDAVTYIGDGAFGRCGFKGTLTLGKSIKTIRPFAFATTDFTGSLIIPNSVTYIGSQAFRGCSGFNETLTIGNSLTSFDYGVFAESGFSSLVLGSSVTSIYNYVFNSCKNLKKIYCLIPMPPTLYFDTFGGVTADVFVPISTSSAYKNTPYWNTFNIIEYVLKVSTQTISKIDSTSATLNGSLDFIAATPVTAYGFCWNTTGSPLVTDNKVDNGAISNEDNFSNTITNLLPGMTYYVRVYALDGERTVYGSELSFTTLTSKVIAGINDFVENDEINIYPNPVKNELMIDFERGSTFDILNLMGQVVFNGNLIKNTFVQTSNLSSGVYLIKFKTGKTFEYKKIIKK